MFSKPSLMTRIAIGKTIGLIFGLLGFFLLPHFDPLISGTIKFGFLFWYITLGAIIAIFGVFTFHPMLNLKMPWYFRGFYMGAWMNFIFTLFAYDTLANLMLKIDFMGLTSPYWFVLEGAIIGLLIDYLATRYGGEGPQCALADHKE